MASSRNCHEITITNGTTNRDFLKHLEAHLAKRDGVQNLLSIAQFASGFILSSSLVHKHTDTYRRLERFGSSVGLARKALHLGNFIDELNLLRNSSFAPNESNRMIFTYLVHGSLGLYLFVDQLLWLEKSGLIGSSIWYGKLSDWTELMAYVGQVGLKCVELSDLFEKEQCLKLGIGSSGSRDVEEKEAMLREVQAKRLKKECSIAMSLLDVAVKLAFIRGWKGFLGNPLLASSKLLLRSLLGTPDIWRSC